MCPDFPFLDDLVLPHAPAGEAGFCLDEVPGLCGYRLEKRLGAGGSGEVWKAVAAGGKAKAVKIVFGFAEERRGARELKSLMRIQELKHSSLLALETVAVVAGRAVIVTELADASLLDRFEQCRAAGQSGIPRDELLGYLAETAAALDYLQGDHALQHLDVKPENLLLFGPRVKVADFGLLKDLTDGNPSLINGMTPKYAAPEVFDGRPSLHSDQYSLAIVFQEMATGSPPFSGRTAAQLASQHLHSDPDLGALSPLERFAVGKALAKDPALRFSTCGEFVARLSPRPRTTVLVGGSSSAAVVRSPPMDQPAARSAAHDGRTLEVQAPEVVRLPPIDLGHQPPDYRPTIFLAIGHTGGRILSRLKQLLVERFGLEQVLPALQMLYIDTDVGAVNEITSASGVGRLAEAETLLLPIHSTWNYRERPVGQLGSLSRRWLYNIPRSQKTEGLRALGRLALLDHADRVKSRLLAAIQTATDSASLAATSAASGLFFRSCDPRVFIVASPGGGTGSGMLIDIAYLTRQLLIETGLSDDVIGILPFVSRGSQSGRDLTAANALACLQELRHFQLAGVYPGEPACGLAGFRERRPTFSHLYFLELGERLDDESFSEAANNVASYLALDAVTPAASFFAASREIDTTAEGDVELRTFALEALGSDSLDVSAQLVDQLCRAIALDWRGRAVAAAGSDAPAEKATAAADRLANAAYLHRLAAEKAGALGLDVRLMCKTILRLSEGRGQMIPAALVNHAISDLLDQRSGAPLGAEPPLAAVLSKIRQLAGLNSAGEGDVASTGTTSRTVLVATGQDHGQELAQTLEEWIVGLVDRAECRVAGAHQVAGWFRERLSGLVALAIGQVQEARQLREQLVASLGAPTQAVVVPGRPLAASVVEELRRYAQVLLQEATLEAVLKSLAIIEAFVFRASDRLRDLWQQLNRLADEFSEAGSTSAGAEQARLRGRAVDATTPLADCPGLVTSDIADEVKDVIERSFLNDDRTLGSVLARQSHLRPQLVAALRKTASQVVRKASRRSIMARLAQALEQGNDADIEQILGKCLTAMESVAGRSGGDVRPLLVLPDGPIGNRITERFLRITGQCPTLACDPQGELIAVYEIQRLPLVTVTNRLVRSRPECESLAARLHTRTDVNFV
jgi:hypothetical protein